MRFHIELTPNEVREIVRQAVSNHHNLDCENTVLFAEGDFPSVSVTLSEELLQEEEATP